MDGLPASGLKDIRDLQQAVAQAQQSAGTGRPLTEASKGWILRAMATPDLGELGPDDVWIYAKGSTLWALSQDGDVPLVEFVRGVSVPDATNNLALAPASYSKAHLDQCINSIDTLFTTVAALKASLEDAGHIAP